MIISIRNEISKSFFFITIKPPSHKKLASTQQLSFPVKSILLNVLKNKQTAIYLLKIKCSEKKKNKKIIGKFQKIYILMEYLAMIHRIN